jgi:hypothetical protein
MVRTFRSDRFRSSPQHRFGRALTPDDRDRVVMLVARDGWPRACAALRSTRETLEKALTVGVSARVRDAIAARIAECGT